jgi:Stigma-specific protein, Stig1
MRGIQFLFAGLILAACGGSSTATSHGKDAGLDSGGGSAGTSGATGGSGGSTGGTAGSGGSTGGTAGSGGSTGGTAGSGGSTGGSAGSGGSTGGSAGTAGTGGGGNCTPQCQFGFACCGNRCVNANNDINNCGTCGHKCTGVHPYCDNGTCGTPPCAGGHACAGVQFCCGTGCCSQGQLCCTVPGPVQTIAQCEDPTPQGTCPTGCVGCVCASPDTPIATPTGDRAIASLRVGDLVYSVNHGRIAVVPIREVNRVPVSHHFVMRVELGSGSVLEISPRHPTTDGRTFGELRAGEKLDGIRIVSAQLEPYKHSATYDILPDSDTGAYFAGGVLIGSTLKQGAVRVMAPTAPYSAAR